MSIRLQLYRCLGMIYYSCIGSSTLPWSLAMWQTLKHTSGYRLCILSCLYRIGSGTVQTGPQSGLKLNLFWSGRFRTCSLWQKPSTPCTLLASSLELSFPFFANQSLLKWLWRWTTFGLLMLKSNLCTPGPRLGLRRYSCFFSTILFIYRFMNHLRCPSCWNHQVFQNPSLSFLIIGWFLTF